MRNTSITSFIVVLAIVTAFSPAVFGYDNAASTAAPLAQDSLTALYSRGNHAYRQGDFADAVRWYESAIEGGAKNASLHYNLGNAYFRLGKTGYAILNYERAIRLDHGNDDARNNLAFMNLLVSGEGENRTSEAQFRETVRASLGRIPVNWLAIGISVGLFGICGVGVLWLLTGEWRLLRVLILTLSAVLLVTSAGIFGVQKLVSDDGAAAIVLVQEVEARFEPNPSAKVSFVLHEGGKVWLDRYEDGWALVKTAAGLRAWLPLRSIEVI